jgi:hypothetical protein
MWELDDIGSSAAFVSGFWSGLDVCLKEGTLK